MHRSRVSFGTALRSLCPRCVRCVFAVLVDTPSLLHRCVLQRRCDAGTLRCSQAAEPESRAGSDGARATSARLTFDHALVVAPRCADRTLSCACAAPLLCLSRCRFPSLASSCGPFPLPSPSPSCTRPASWSRSLTGSKRRSRSASMRSAIERTRGARRCRRESERKKSSDEEHLQQRHRGNERYKLSAAHDQRLRAAVPRPPAAKLAAEPQLMLSCVCLLCLCALVIVSSHLCTGQRTSAPTHGWTACAAQACALSEAQQEICISPSPGLAKVACTGANLRPPLALYQRSHPIAGTAEE